MNRYRVVKYSEAERTGVKDSWTAISDIGRSYDGVVLTEEEYLRTEQKYLAVIQDFLRAARVGALTVDSLEIHPESPWWGRVQEGEELTPDRAVELARSILREEDVWCLLEGEGGFYVHLATDYYMFVGTPGNADDCVARARSAGLYVDEMVSPFLED
ncbi:hypothetical protein ACFVVL_31980 [Kitasatospora sp. NPDC058115]|uniref:hypothetical protein n=1 Tax=Kitasatospora sp. NPDC058115 TaxID=3346347 RepID=UPI0036DDDB95